MIVGMSKKLRKLEKKSELIRKFKKMWHSGQSEVCEVRNSSIHGRGVYATCDITKGDNIIEYIGELINKKESARRANVQAARAAKLGDAAVYIFTIDDKYDLDGNLPWNTARLINHSCEPNCEAWIDGKRIHIHALHKINKGDELSFDYGFDVETWEEHPCRCGKKSCVGHIVSREQWSELEKKKTAHQPPIGGNQRSRKRGAAAE
jgi:hypothetical protein